jgi:hypothetical protein|tara:strand:- start:2536 stop:2646 length:111 start_codon:yes stop_codon:yes gene_type:complete
MTIGRSSIRMQLTDKLKNKVTKKKKKKVKKKKVMKT